MTLKELYQIYGEKMVALEILQNQIGECKKQIAAEINKPREVDAKPIAPPDPDAK